MAIVTALQHNTTLKILDIHFRHFNENHRLTRDEGKQMAALLKKNYSLETLVDLELNYEAGDVSAIWRLNAAGRRYLIEDGSCISKGVEVLSRVNHDINCVFLHLLENPSLCNRSAVEMVTDASESNGSRSMSPNASSGGGKREQAGGHKCKEFRRRLE
jgi:hypothetical protein